MVDSRDGVEERILLRGEADVAAVVGTIRAQVGRAHGRLCREEREDAILLRDHRHVKPRTAREQTIVGIARGQLRRNLGRLAIRG